MKLWVKNTILAVILVLIIASTATVYGRFT